MAGNSSVLEDGSLLSRLDRTLFKFESFLTLLGGFAVFSLMILAVLSVGGRNFLGLPLPGYVDWIEQVMPMIAFLGIAYAQRTGGHIRMDILIGRLHGRPLWVVEFITVLFMLILMLLLVYGSYFHFERSFDFSAPLWSRDSSMDIAIPLWPMKLVIPVSFSVISLRLMLQVWGYARAIKTGSLQPIAVPLIEDAATVAAKEAHNYSDAEKEAR